MGTAWGDRLGFVWVSKHPDTEVGVGWDGWTQPSEIKACPGLGNGQPISRWKKNKKKDEQKTEGVGARIGWQGLQHARPVRDRRKHFRR